MTGAARPYVFMIAGEPSGDMLGAALIRALRQRTGGVLRVAGIGGEEMAAEGVESLAPIADLAIMGLAEVLPRYPRIRRHVRAAAAAILDGQPDAVVTIDSAGFTWRVAKRVRGIGGTMPLIHYVAPMVWAWRPGRAKRMAGWYDHLMTLFPFEPPWFERVGLAATHVGHPVLESGADRGDADAFRARHGLRADTPLLCLLPGSRRGEVVRLLPEFEGAVALLRKDWPGMRTVLPTVAHLAGFVRERAGAWADPPLVVGLREKADAFAASTAALAASGTVSLELAMAGVPAVIGYRINAVTAAMLRRLLRIPYASMVNLVVGRPAVPELLLEQCTPERLSSAVAPLLSDGAAREAQREAYRECLVRLGAGGPSAALRAADTVLGIIAGRARHAD